MEGIFPYLALEQLKPCPSRRAEVNYTIMQLTGSMDI
jgi:hypothetical protein